MEILTVSCLQISVKAAIPKIQVKKGKEVLCTEHLATDGSLKDISFSLQQGEILGFFGRSGSGRNTLSKALFGIEPLTSGTIYIDRLPTRITCPQDALDLGLAYITDATNRHWNCFPS